MEDKQGKTSRRQDWPDVSECPVSENEGKIRECAGPFGADCGFAEGRNSDERFKKLVENLQEGIWEVDRHFEGSFVNSRMAGLLGYSVEEMAGRSFFDFIDEKSTPALESRLKGRKYKLNEPLEVQFVKKDGARIHALLEYAPYIDESGGFSGALTSIMDISERKKAEMEKLELEARLRQSAKLEAIGTLAGGIAHDFNNILSSIIGFTELSLFSIPQDHSLRGNLEEILKAGNRAADLVRQILMFGRRTRLEKMPIRTNSIVKEALKMLRSTLPATIAIKDNITSEPLAIVSEPSQIHQLVVNLCTNAAHAMFDDGGLLEITLDRVETDRVEPDRSDSNDCNETKPENGFLRLRVSDTGCGIPKEQLEKIFDPYYTANEQNNGSGLGLSVVHGIAASHGGRVDVESEPGKGSVFSVYLPLARTKEKRAPAPRLEELPRGSESILFVDDEPQLARMQKANLDKLGYKVNAFTDSLAALSEFRKNPDKYRVIITDMAMPDMSGAKLAEEIKKISPDIAVILCTGYSDSIDEKKAAELGIDEFLLKPVDSNHLATSIREAINRKAISR